MGGSSLRLHVISKCLLLVRRSAYRVEENQDLSESREPRPATCISKVDWVTGTSPTPRRIGIYKQR